MFDRLREDISTFKRRDPAARSALEIFFLYPGLKAIRMHRRANWCYRHRMFFLARWISQRAARKTGIEIHPAATIGRRFFIDHGTGVVIGETAVIGDDVMIYQGVTLGGTGKDTGKRHPTIGNNVMIGAGAKVLGPFKVGDNSNIAAGAVVLDEIPPDCTAVGVPAHIVRRNGVRVDDLDQVHIPDPVAQEICKLQFELDRLEKRIRELEKEQAAAPAKSSEMLTQTSTAVVPKTSGCSRIHNEHSRSRMPVKTVQPAPGTPTAVMSPPSPIVPKPRSSSQNPRMIGRATADRETLNISMIPRMISMIPPTSIHPRPVTKCRLEEASTASSTPETSISQPKSTDSPR